VVATADGLIQIVSRNPCVAFFVMFTFERFVKADTTA
jgi:hypothetical protein